MFKGKQGIIWMALPTDKQITTFGEMLGSSGSLTDLKSVSGEMEITGRRFPFKFNIMCAPMLPADSGGAGNYTLEIHCTDPSISVTRLAI
jgi:hypothetical protein